MKYAKITDGVVDIISLVDPKEDGWVEIGDEVHAGFELVGGQFVEADRPPAFPDGSAAYSALVAWVNDFTAGFAPAVPDAERQAFAAKEAASRAYVTGTATASQAAILRAEAAITGETADELAALVIAEADTAAQISARVSGLRRAVKTQLDTATNPAQLEGILDAAKVQARAMAGELGLTAAPL